MKRSSGLLHSSLIFPLNFSRWYIHTADEYGAVGAWFGHIVYKAGLSWRGYPLKRQLQNATLAEREL
jgi:hypothetical protein